MAKAQVAAVVLNAETLIAELKARIQCKHCGKTSHYSDHCFRGLRDS